MTLRERAIEQEYQRMLEVSDGSIPLARLRQMAEAHVDTVLSPLWDRADMPHHYLDRGGRVTRGRSLKRYDIWRGRRNRDAEDKRRVEVSLVSTENMRLRKAHQLLADRADAPARQLEAYRLTQIDGLSYAEAGQKMGISRQAVGALVTKFRRGVDRSLESVPKGEERSVIPLPTTTISDFLTLTLNLDDLADVTELPVEHLEGLAGAGAFDGALIGTPARFRPYAAAIALLANELGLLIESGALGQDEAAETFTRALPLAEELFAEALTNAKDCRSVLLTVLDDGSEITLNFHRQAALSYARLLLGAKG